MRYRIDLAFHGAGFHGWQRQPGLRTVQGELEDWLTNILRGPEPIALTGAGRTDAGVHAELMVAHFDSDSPLDPDELNYKLSAALPDDVVVHRITPVEAGFHARYGAVAKTYVYRICTVRTPFNLDRAWRIHSAFDCDAATAAAELVLGKRDFSGFCRATSQKPGMTCDVSESTWQATEDGFSYRVRADRFLHGMVRLMVGTMVDIARGRWPAARMAEILESGDVRLCGAVAPPQGLTLVDIEYPVNA